MLRLWLVNSFIQPTKSIAKSVLCERRCHNYAHYWITGWWTNPYLHNRQDFTFFFNSQNFRLKFFFFKNINLQKKTIFRKYQLTKKSLQYFYLTSSMLVTHFWHKNLYFVANCEEPISQKCHQHKNFVSNILNCHQHNVHLKSST